MELYDGTVLIIAVFVCVIILGSAAIEFFNENNLDKKKSKIIITSEDDSKGEKWQIGRKVEL